MRYHMDDGAVVDTFHATQSWKEATYWDGRNHVSVPTGSQWAHQMLHRSRKGRYYLESWSDWQGSKPRAEWISKHAAAAWLLANRHELPSDLVGVADAIQ